VLNTINQTLIVLLNRDDIKLHIFCQTSNTDMYVNWDGFQDVEEFSVGPHPTGIKEYILGIGKCYNILLE